jgi:P-type Ca2+ transporter type 2C
MHIDHTMTKWAERAAQTAACEMKLGQKIETVPHSPHGLPAAEVLARLGVSVAAGLAEPEARRRHESHGPNTIVSRRKVSAFAVLLHQFRSPVVYLLAGAAGLALYFGEWQEASAIAAVLALNGLIGFVTEIRAARSIEALRALGSRSARVRRDGHTRLIPAEQLVPGDVVLLEGGDSVSADMRLVEASNLAADESTLTGESMPVDKSVAPVAADARLSDRTPMLFKGTAVARGSGVAVVAATGLATELGRITQLVEEAEPESSPLEKKLARLSSQLVWATLILAALIGGVGLATGKDAFLMVEAAIALAVAAIPEGLPIVATLALARGMWRMARQNALIERLSAVETLGATTVILTDKTGTLTENRMTVRRAWVPSGEIDFGELVPPSFEAAETIPLRNDPQVRCLMEIVVLCNNASLGHAAEEDSGDPMELALLRAGRLAMLDRAALLRDFPPVHKHAFDVATKMMATVHRRGDRCFFAVKGAPEAVLAKAWRVISENGAAAMSDTLRAEWLQRVEQLGHHGLRVLACAMKDAASPDAPPFENLTFVGLIGLEDPARADVPHAIRACRQAGIRVIMVTGDHAVTARSVGRAVGLGGVAPRVVEGADVARLASADRGELMQANIFARVSPAEKLALVHTYQAAGEIVAMTGDGVNDAPALKRADIGVAMGLRGTDVAREAAAMVLLDDSFPTIVTAIHEGRVIFGNIRRFVAYLLSCNLSEILVVGLAILSTLPLPILPLQILYLNLVTDVFPAFALAMGEGERNVMQRPPRDPQEPILGRVQWVAIVMQGITLTVGAFGALVLSHLWLGLDDRSVVTVTFLTLAFAQLWHVFNMCDPDSPLIRNEVTRNPWVWGSLLLCTVLLVTPAYLPPLAHVLHLVQPDLRMWTVILIAGLAPLPIAQGMALVLRRQRSGDGS